MNRFLLALRDTVIYILLVAIIGAGLFFITSFLTMTMKLVFVIALAIICIFLKMWYERKDS